MVRTLIAAGAVLAFIEFYSLGVWAAAKKAGERRCGLAFIPFYAFYLTGKMTGEFTILTIPVKKYHGFMLVITLLGLGAHLYASWGATGLPAVSSEALWQIMYIVFVLAAGLAYISLLTSSRKFYRRFNIARENLFVLLSVPIVTLPLLYIAASKNPPRPLSEMY